MIMVYTNDNYTVVYWVDSCRDCGGGGQLIIVKDPKSGEFFLMCDDCGQEWKNPFKWDNSNRLPSDWSSEVKYIKNATWEEIKGLGWDKYVKGNMPDFNCN